MTHLPACNLDWLDWSLFIWGRWWWQCRCHYLRLATLLILKDFHGGPHPIHEVAEIFRTVICSEKLVPRELPSPPADDFALASYSHMTYTLWLCFKCVCFLNLCSISQTQTFLHENCFAVHQITITPLGNLFFTDNVIWLWSFFFYKWACWETGRHIMHLLLNSAADLGVGEFRNPSSSLFHGLNCTKHGMNIWQHSP